MLRANITQHAKWSFAMTIGRALLAFVFLPSMPARATDDLTNTAVIPVSKLEQDAYDWFGRHAQVLELQKTLDPQIVLIGDSITHFWGGEPKSIQNGPKSWSKTFGDCRVLNMGFGWDRTQNVLWRLDHGEMDGIHPKLVVLNIGTNNFTETRNAHANTPKEVADAVVLIRDKISAKAPTAHIIVMGIFPRGAKANDPARTPRAQTNQLLAKSLEGKPRTSFIDLTNRLLQSDGSISPDVMGDATHPTEKGYEIWGNALIAAGMPN